MRTNRTEVIEIAVARDIGHTVEMVSPKNGFAAGRGQPHGITMAVEIPVYSPFSAQELTGKVNLAPGQVEENILQQIGYQLAPVQHSGWWGIFDRESRQRVSADEDLYEALREGRQFFARALMKNEMTRWQRFFC
jgi:sugar phosphate isomerase/epimerase